MSVALKSLILTRDTEVAQPPLPNVLEAATQNVDSLDLARAAIDLQKVVHYLNIATGGITYSLAHLAATGLPRNIAVVLWVTPLLFAEEAEQSELSERFLQQQNKDARTLLRFLEQAKSLHDEWWETNVQALSLMAFPAGIRFPLGHPLPDRLYRRHLLPQYPMVYYPADSYYALLYAERERELIKLMADLGATRIALWDAAPLSQELKNADPSGAIAHCLQTPRTFELPPPKDTLEQRFQAARYAWLPYEPSWQAVVDSRFRYRCRTASVQLSLDVAHFIAGIIDGVESILQQMHAIHPIDLDMLKYQTLAPCRVEVEFAP